MFRRTLADLLEQEQASVVDVVRGSAPGTRRLLVAPEGSGVTLVVSVVAGDRASVLDAEERVLAPVSALSPGLAQTMPRPLGRLLVDERQVGSVMTAVPGLGPRTTATARVPTARLLTAVDHWLDLLWRETAGAEAEGGLAADLVADFARRHGTSPLVAAAVRQLAAAQGRVAEHPVQLVMVHGCLCTRHLQISEDRVIGVDDWATGSPAAHPLVDLGGLGARLAQGRLPEVLLGRSGHARALQRFLTRGLIRLALPRRLWRDVLVLGQFRLALEGLEQGRTEGMTVLMRLLGDTGTTGRGARPGLHEGGP